MDTLQHFQKNHLLSALPENVLMRWRLLLEPTDLPQARVVYETGTLLSHVYFPTTAVISLQYVMNDGLTSEVAMVGNDGMVGVATVLGGGSAINQAVVHQGGEGFRMKATDLNRELENSMPVRLRFLLYVQSLVVHVTQNGACIKHHSVEQQLCRWMLQTLDRYGGSELRLIKQQRGYMASADDEAMNTSVQNLEKIGLIDNANYCITVLDRAGLERHSCECHRLVKSEQERLLIRQ